MSVTAAAARLGLPLANLFVDAGVSGSLAIADRPVLMEAVSALRRGDVLLVANVPYERQVTMALAVATVWVCRRRRLRR